MWVTKKKLRNRIAELEAQIIDLTAINGEMLEASEIVADKLIALRNQFPLTIGETVYDLQLRSSKGRFTKKNASKEHSVINEVVVDTKNYFNLVARYNSKDVFTDYTTAEEYMNAVCVE